MVPTFSSEDVKLITIGVNAREGLPEASVREMTIEWYVFPSAGRTGGIDWTVIEAGSPMLVVAPNAIGATDTTKTKHSSRATNFFAKLYELRGSPKGLFQGLC